MGRRNPLHHGTSYDFRSFKKTVSDWLPGLGVWLTDDRSAAKYFADTQAERYGRPESAKIIVADVIRGVDLKTYEEWSEFMAEWNRMRPASRMRKHLMKQGFGGFQVLRSTTDTLQKIPRRDVCVFDPKHVQILSKGPA